MGELLKELARVPPEKAAIKSPATAASDSASPYGQALSDNSISSQQASRYQALANRMRAERRAGELLAVMPKATGGLPYQSTGTLQLPVEKPIQTLSDLGITKNQSSRWQKLAAVTETQFEQALGAVLCKFAELVFCPFARFASFAPTIARCQQ